MKSTFAHTNLPPLPKNWVWSTMNDVCLKVQDGTHFSPQNQLPHGRYRYLTAKNIRPLGLDLSDVSYIEEEEHRAIYTRCDPKKGDVLLVKDGVNTGDVALNTLDNEFSLLSSVCLLRPKPDLLSSPFLRYFLQSPVGARLLTGKMTGTAIRRIVLRQIKETPIPIAPLFEQQSLVAEIEKQFSRLDEAVAILKRVKANLKRYKAAVLKAAVEGKLTEEWRKAHPDVEPASELLKRILAERRAKWSGRGNYKEPKIDHAVECSEGWVGVPVEVISEIVDGDRGKEYPKQEDFLDQGYCLFLSTKNVRPYGFVFKENQFISKDKHEKLRKGTLKPGDIVFTSRGTIGNIAHYSDDIKYKCVRINSGMFILRGFYDLLDEGYFAWYLRSHAIREQIAKLSSGTAQPQLPIREFKTFNVHFPSKLEQEEIVKDIERRVSIIDRLETSAVQAEKRAERLRQAVLQRAFSGALIGTVGDSSFQLSELNKNEPPSSDR